MSTSQRACHSGAETLAAEVEATTDPLSTTSQPSCSQFDGVSGQQVDASSSCPPSHTPAASNTQCCVAANQTASQRSTEMRRIRFNLHSKGPRPALVKFQIALPPAGSQQTPKNQRNGNLILEPRQTPSSTPDTEDRRTGFTGPRQRSSRQKHLDPSPPSAGLRPTHWLAPGLASLPSWPAPTRP